MGEYGTKFCLKHCNYHCHTDNRQAAAVLSFHVVSHFDNLQHFVSFHLSTENRIVVHG